MAKHNRKTYITAFGRESEPGDVLTWFALVVNAYGHLSPEDKTEVDAWTDEYVDGSARFGTSDWPRWGEFIDLEMFWPWQNLPGERRGPTNDRRAPTVRWDCPAEGFYLYRLWGDEGRLLYVGVSRALRARIRTHSSQWGELIREVTWEEHPDAESMLSAETAAIREEMPALNKAKV